MRPRNLQVVGGALISAGRCLVARRSAAMSDPLLWEFPGGKVEAGETHEAALVRELVEELAVHVQVKSWLGRGEVVRPAARIVLDVYACVVVKGTPRAIEHAELRWVDGEAIRALQFAEADIPVLDPVIELLKQAARRGTR